MKQVTSTFLLAAIFASLVTAGCGGETAAPSGAGTTAAVASAAREMESRDGDDRDGRDGDDRDHDGDRDDDDRVSYFMTVLNELRAVPALAPLFDRYRVPNPIAYDDHAYGLVSLLRAVRITLSSGTVTVTNRETGGVIYSAPLADLDSGTFLPENMPGATNPPPATTCTAFTYSAWGACQSSNTQSRTVTSSTPNGCTGGSPITSQACTYVPPAPATCTAFTYSPWGACQSNNTQTRTVTTSSPTGCAGGSPVTSQACTYTPPVIDGAALYAAKCASCHGPLATSTKKGRTAQQITASGMTMGLTAAEVQAVAAALAVTTPPPPATCTSFSYSAWGACQSNNSQSRTVTGSSPTGCTGGSPVTTQACTYVPPVTTCSAFTYSAWGACQSNNSQSRTVTSSSPTGCTGGSPVTTQACTYTPPACTYTYSAWSACSASGTQTRTVASSSPASCAGTPVLTQACTPPAASCTTCHGIPPSSGKHSRHTSFASCSTCHGSGYSTTTVNSATHQNGVKNVASTIGWNASAATCANSCHGSRSW